MCSEYTLVFFFFIFMTFSGRQWTDRTLASFDYLAVFASLYKNNELFLSLFSPVAFLFLFLFVWPLVTD